ncbi:MAG: lysophospholipase [Myxococcota bacterium]
MQESMKEGFFAACAGTFDLFYQAYKAQSDATGSVVLVHGFSEYSGRYTHVVDALVHAGLNVLLFDLPGHGHSSGMQGHIDSFQQYVDSAKSAIDQANQLFDNADITLLGHSMGGLVSIHAVAQSPSLVRRLILSNPLCASRVRIPAWQRLLIHAIARVRPKQLFSLAIAPEKLSHNQQMVQLYANDPLCIRQGSARCLLQLQEAMQLCEQCTHQLQLPVLLQLASDDWVVDINEARRLFAHYRAAGSKTVVYEGFYHEIYNEVEWQRPVTDLTAWIKGLQQQA